MKCDQQALFRYTWAGRNESFCCLEHAQQLQGVAQAIGYYIQLIPLSGDEQMKVSCQQEVRANNRVHVDAASASSAEPDSSPSIVPAVESDTQPRQ